MIIIILFLALSVREAQAQESHQPSVVLSEADIVEIVQSDSLPFSLPEMTARLRASIKLDRVLLRQRMWQLLRAWQRLEATRAEIVLLRQVRANLAMMYHLNIEKQKRSQIADSEVLRSQIEVIHQDVALLHFLPLFALLINAYFFSQEQGSQNLISLCEPPNFKDAHSDRLSIARGNPPPHHAAAWFLFS